MSHFACWTGGVLCGIALTCVGLWVVEESDVSRFWQPLARGEFA